MDEDFHAESKELVPLNITDEDDSLKAVFLRMYQSKENTDVKIVLQHEQQVLGCFEAHKLIVASRSPVFADMFWRNDNSSPKVVQVDGVSVRSIEMLLWFIYSDTLEAKAVGELIEVAKAARHFQVGGLVRLCKRQLSKIPVDINNVFYILEASYYFQMENKQKICMKYIMSYPKKLIFRSQGFLKVSERTIWNILKERDISSVDEIHFLEGVIHWLTHQNSSKRKLLSEIFILSITSEKFLDIIETFPSFFSYRETAAILSNLVRPGSTHLPSWCKPNDQLPSYPTPYDEISLKTTKVKTDCNICFKKSYFLGVNNFNESSIFEIKLSRESITHLTMLQLAFGSNFIPEEHLELQLFHFENGTILKKKMVEFSLNVTSDHYYIILHNRLGVSRYHPLVLHLELLVNGLRTWGADGPVSNGQYRVVLVPGDIFYNMKLNAMECGGPMCLTLLSDWLVFLDPISGEKRLVITSFYFDP